MRRRLLGKAMMGGAALVVAVGGGLAATLVGPASVAGAAGVQDPIMCNVSGTATFNPPLTQAGSNTGKGSVETVTLTGFTESNCVSSSSSGAPTGGTIPATSIRVAATKVGSGKATQYLTGYCPGFASTSSLKALRKVTLTSNWSGGEGRSTQIETKKAGIATNNLGEAGFAIVGKFITGSYPLKPVQITAYLTAAESTALAGQCATGPVSSITFDGSTSTILQ